ncbi:response regulator [Clostridium butyricum]|uniref:response regulator n=1 Tax=Clostridium butyricum TaxID=1492 RepID=UPI00346660A4
MDILLIEDDDIKASNIEEFLQNKIKKIIRKKSWQTGLVEIVKNRSYDLILLDMSMPRYDYDGSDNLYEFEPFAGWEIMKEMKRRKINISTIVITSFGTFGKDENRIDVNGLNDKLELEFSNFYKGIIRYNSSIVTWKEELEKVLK